MIRALSIGLLLVAMTAASGAETASPKLSNSVSDLTALLEPIRVEYRLPALAGAILVEDRVTAIGATGLRRQGGKERVTARDRWHLGSCGKAMTATVIARLVERGTLAWDTTVAEGLPAFVPTMHAEYRDATLRQLLQHRAGVPGDLVGLSIWSWLWRYQGEPALERGALAKFLLDRKPEVPPGTRTLYANGGYAIAGALAEQATGLAWEELVQKELFAPLEMRSAGFGAPGTAKGVEAPWGHRDPERAVERGDRARKAGGGLVAPGPDADNPPAISPAGTVHASLEDWARFAALHLGADRSDPALLSAESLETLHTPPAGESYALGWITAPRDWAGGPALQHRGSNSFWTALVWLAPKRGFGVLVATNQGGGAAAKAVDAAAAALIQRHLGGS